MAVHRMLIEMAIQFEAKLVDIDAGAQHDPAYLKLNPAGHVPTLIVDGVPRHESVALLMLLAERHPEAALAPGSGSPDHPEWLETTVYLANTVLPATRDWFYASTDGDPAGALAVRALAERRIEAACAKLDTHFASGRADFLAVVLMRRWTRNMPRPALTWPHLADYIRRLRALPSFIDLNAREKLTEWRNEDD
ncbi:MAG: Glutathione S-transferase (EC [uncultured Paraburkholderia sp.]|nr:MAG: Glutathione S-transferase (EC [uncultured Paraburkholderia sp.]CAH2944779.1 MAG: Glutathione S-transferase (EC [uncultured Paraburkholderia sp.]